MAIRGDQKKCLKEEDAEVTITGQSGDDNFTERRVIRSGYLSIQNFIRDQRDEIAASSPKKFLSFMNEVDGMHHYVKKPREQVSDAEALRDLANTLVTSIRVHSTGSVTPSVFISSLLTQYGENARIGMTKKVQISWKDMGLHVSPLFMIGRGSCTMLGAVTHESELPKVVVARKRRRSSVKEEKVKPEELEDTVSKEKKETEKIIGTMFNMLKTNTKVLLENLVLNRISFAQTVENLFALSFLVKDGRVEIAVDDKGSHHVSPRNAPASGMIMSGKVAYSHFIFRFDFNDWKLMKNLVPEDTELMPRRTKLNPCGGCQSEAGLKENNIPTIMTYQRKKHYQEIKQS